MDFLDILCNILIISVNSEALYTESSSLRVRIYTVCIFIVRRN
jgi:hypothetical protein